MPATHDVLRNLALVLGVAAVTTVLFRRLRLPVVFGYMLAGVIVGPHVPVPLVADADAVHTLSELGIVLLMFALGLELSLRRLVRAGGGLAMIAALECSLMLLAGGSAARALGWSPLASLYAGAAVAVSSTTIVARTFAERRAAGRFVELAFGVLVFEDLVAILLLAALTPASSGAIVSTRVVAFTVVRLGAFLAVLLAGGMLVVPRLVRLVVRLERPETTLVASVGLCFGAALLTRAIGYPAALGAFLAGALVAESGEETRVLRLVEPVRDVFAAVFFVSVGMSLDPALVVRHAGAVLLFTAVVLIGKTCAVSLATFLSGAGTRTSIQTGMSLAQIGEFSFIIAAAGVTSGAAPAALYSVAITVSALTTLATPWLVGAAAPAAATLDRALPRPLQTFAALYGSWLERMRARPETSSERARVRRALRGLALDAAVIAALALGAGLGGAALGDRLVAAGWRLGHARAAVTIAAGAAALPFLLGIVRTARTVGEALARRAFPEPANGRLDLAAAPRQAMVVTLQGLMVLAVGAPLAIVLQPLLPPLYGAALMAAVLIALAVAIWRGATQLHGHVRAGAEAIVEAIARHARAGSAGAAERALQRAYQVLPGLGEPVPARIEASHAAAGQPLAALGLRGRTGATIVAISRGDEVVLVPDGHERLRAGDVVALAGTREAVAAARALLVSGRAPGETAAAGAAPAPDALEPIPNSGGPR